MKLLNTKIVFALATMFLLFTSCSKEENPYENPNLSVDLQGFEMEEGEFELEYFVTNKPEGEFVELFLMYFTQVNGEKIEGDITNVAEFEYELNGRTVTAGSKDYLRIPINNESENMIIKVTLKEDYIGRVGKLYGFADSSSEKDYVTFDFVSLQAVK